MWICVSVIDREIDVISGADTKEEICEMMLNDIYDYFTKKEFKNDIKHGNAEYNDSDLFAWSNANNKNYNWKCFWV